MPIKTQHYMLEAFIDGDAYLAVSDRRRFSTIDNQLNRVSEIILDGRIEGWEVITAFPNITITSGSGLINKFYVNTFGDRIFEINDNSVFFVFAQRKIGIVGTQGPKSNIVSVTYTDDGPPNNPSNFTSSVIGQPSNLYKFIVQLLWDSNTEIDLDHYEIEVSKDSSPFTLIAVVEKTDSSYEDETEEDINHEYRICAVDQSGNKSDFVSSVISTPLSVVLPQSPIHIETYASHRSINILWERPPATPFDIIQYWKITYFAIDTDGSKINSTEQSILIDKELYNYRIDNLQSGQPYKIIIQTIDTKNRESSGVITESVPQYTTSPPDPHLITYTNYKVGSGIEVDLSWSHDEYVPDAFRYKVYVTINGQQESLGIDVPIGFTSEQISLYTYDLLEYYSIPENVLITFRITSVNEDGFESLGSYIRFVTSILTSPLRLKNIISTFNPDNKTIVVSWDNNNDTHDINIVIDEENTETLVSNNIINENIGRIEKYIINNVQLGHKYTSTLTPFNSAGMSGPPAATVGLTIIPGGLPLPLPPLDISIKSNDKQLVLTWNSSPTPYVSFYKIYRKIGAISINASDWELLDTMPNTTLSFADYGLINNTTYSYYIISQDVYGRDSLHLPNSFTNLNFIQATPKESGLLSEPKNIDADIVGTDVILTWTTMPDEFEGFTIYRSVNNLHSWTAIANVSNSTLVYTDENIPLVDGIKIYYVIDKSVDDAQILLQSSESLPSNSILLYKITVNDTNILIDSSNRRDIKDLIDPISESVSSMILPHRHFEIGRNSPSRIDLNPELIVTDWNTLDGKTFFTNEIDIIGTSFILKVNDKFPSVFFTIDEIRRQIIFAEQIATVNPDGSITDMPNIELKVLGVEEVQNILESERFDYLHARQVQFGILNKNQLPNINHEGRIREKLFPERFLLERYNNYTFIVPQTNTDPSKNFGTGTTYYDIIESDGSISEVIDWDLFDDNIQVGFRNPSFSSLTVLNLKQNQISSNIKGHKDNVNFYRFNPGDIVTGEHASTKGNLYLMTMPPQVNSLIGNTDTEPLRSFFIDNINQKFYGIEYTGSEYNLVSIDPATAQVNEKIEINSGVIPVAAEFAEGTIYLFNSNGNTLESLDPESGETTVLFSLSAEIKSMSYINSESTMYVTRENGGNDLLTTLDLNTGAFSPVPGDALSDFGISLWYRMNDGGGLLEEDKLYYIDNSNKIYRIENRNAGTVSDIELTSWSLLSISSGITFNNNWWLTDNDGLKMGNFTGLQSDVFLRFEINVPEQTTVGNSEIEFTSIGSFGDNVQLSISIVDPSEYSDETNLSFSSISLLSTIGSVQWNPPEWELGEKSNKTTVSVTNLVQLFVDSESYFKGRHIIFKIQTLPSTTTGHYRIANSFYSENEAPQLQSSYVIDVAKVTSDPGGFQSNKAYKFEFEFEDNSPTRWVQITTFDTENKPNPVIKLSHRLRFKLFLDAGYSIYLSLGVREIDITNLSIGANGGTIGEIEWVGASSLVSIEDGSVAPEGILITGTGEWQDVDINIPKLHVLPFFDKGNGMLNKNKLGVLEHFAFTIDHTSDNATGPFVILIDKLEQVTDVIASGTSQGLLVSQDFGITWRTSRLTDTPVFKFYKAKNNRFLWAISSTEVFLSTDPDNWFATQGTEGIDRISDIVDDQDGNVFISSDKGVYWLDISIIRTFSTFRQTQAVNAFSTDMYALYHYKPNNEIWVSTEIGMYKTNDKGETWTDANISTAGLVLYQIINLGTDDEHILFAITRKHILRKHHTDSNFNVISNMEIDHNIFNIWKMEFFAGRLYISTEKGIYANDNNVDIYASESVIFNRVLHDINFNGFIQQAFGMRTVLVNNEEKLFIGLENKLVQVSESQKVSTKTHFPNKELPSFYIDNEEQFTGYVYNSFNGVLVFREPLLANKLVSATYLPRQRFFAQNGGWSQSNPEAEIFIYKNGFPKWLDFDFDESAILGEMQILNNKLLSLEILTSYNSLVPNSQILLEKILTNIRTIRQGGESESPVINNETIIEFLNNYSRFLSMITESFANRNSLFPIPIIRTGIPIDQRNSLSRANKIEELEQFSADNSVGINIDVNDGEVDFQTAFINTTNPAEREKLSFSKFDHMHITVFNSNVKNTGEYTHIEIEDKMEGLNTGLSSRMSKSMYTNMIKSGILIEQQHNNFYNIYNVSNIQNKFFAAYTNEWYDVPNSTVDYNEIIKTSNIQEPRFSNVVFVVNEPYLHDAIWIGTDNGIVLFKFDEQNELYLYKTISPMLNKLFIWDIWSQNHQDIYVVAMDESNLGHIFITSDYGDTWEEEQTTNLPNRIYKFRIINGIKVVFTEHGVFYNDNQFGTWFPSSVVPSDNLPENSPSINSFHEPIFNVEQSTFLSIESNKWFYTSGNGYEFFALAGQILSNNVATVNKIIRHKNITWIGTDRGLYNDGNSLLSDSVQWGFQTDIEENISQSMSLKINDITYGTDALYVGAHNGKIYRFFDSGSGMEWKGYQVPNFGTIHKIIVFEDISKIAVISYNKIRLIDISENSGVF